MRVFCARFLDVISRGNQCSRHDMWAVLSSQCLPLSKLAAVYYTEQDLTEISLKGYLFVCWLMKLSIASSVVNQLVAAKVSSK